VLAAKIALEEERFFAAFRMTAELAADAEADESISQGTRATT
jgi:hypothetical protein